MFQQTRYSTTGRSALATFELIFHVAVRHVRKSHGNAVIGLLLNVFQTVLLITIFYLLFALMGMRGSPIRGDMVLYVMSGVFMFMTHVKAMGAVSGADGPTSPMMKHSPMNTAVSIGAAALSALYLQFTSAAVVLYVYHAAITPITIDQPVGTMAMFLLAWASGAAIGLIVMAAKPWWPEVIGMGASIYQRMNMIFSGKMFVANTMPSHMRGYFDWNPLYHIIDQTRGYVFLNYTPQFTSTTYPLMMTGIFFALGMMIEFYTRKHASASWGAGR